MPTHQLSIIDRKRVVEGTTEIVLGITGKEFLFKPGQYAHLTLPNLIFQDPKGNGRDFSVVSSPNNHDTISVAFRNSGSGFKKSILEMPIGSFVEISGPFGSFTLPEDSSRSVVCVAGGIGVTPFLSMIRYATENKLPHKIILIYANKDEEGRGYRKELDELAQENSNFSVQYNIGSLAPESLKTIAGHEKNALWYIAGPEGMVRSALSRLSEIGILEDVIHTEEFSGYRDENRTETSLYKATTEATIHSFALGGGSSSLLPTDLNALLQAMDTMAIMSQADVAGNIVYVNNKFIEISKYSQEELIGNNHRILKSGFHPQAFYDDMWHNYLLKGRAWRGEIKNKAKDGSLYWVDVIITPVISGEGKIVGYISIRFDITEKKTSQTELEHKKDYYQALSENSTDMVTVLRDDGTVSYTSPSFFSILGYSSEEIKGRKIFEFMHQDDLSMIGQTFEKVIQNPTNLHTVEFRFLHKDGSWRNVEAIGKNLLSHPAISGIVCNCRDVTKRKESEEKLKTRTAELEESNKLMVGRELRMIELKEELATLKERMKQGNDTHD